MVKIDHNRRCFIADLDFPSRVVLEAFYRDWLALINPWCIRDPEGNMKFTVDFRGYTEILDSLRMAREVSVDVGGRDVADLVVWYRENYGGSRLFMKRILEYIRQNETEGKRTSLNGV